MCCKGKCDLEGLSSGKLWCRWSWWFTPQRFRVWDNWKGRLGGDGPRTQMNPWLCCSPMSVPCGVKSEALEAWLKWVRRHLQGQGPCQCRVWGLGGHMDPGAGLNKSLPLPELHALLHVRVRECTVGGLNDTPSSYLPGTGTLRKQLWMKCEKRKQNRRDLYSLIWWEKQTSFSFFFCALSFYYSLFTGPTNVILYPDLLFLCMLACRHSCHMSVQTQISFSSPYFLT